MSPALKPTLVPLGDGALLVRFGDSVSEDANRAAIAAASILTRRPAPGVVEVAPGLVSVLLRYAPGTDFRMLSREVSLALRGASAAAEAGAAVDVDIRYDGADVAEVAAKLGLSAAAFVARHSTGPLRVLATGFAPGFVYCGFHAGDLVVPRREHVRPVVPAGTVLFAAGQTAIAATPIRTGWHIIGRTAFQNFDPTGDPPTRVRAGDTIRFVPA